MAPYVKSQNPNGKQCGEEMVENQFRHMLRRIHFRRPFQQTLRWLGMRNRETLMKTSATEQQRRSRSVTYSVACISIDLFANSVLAPYTESQNPVGNLCDGAVTASHVRHMLRRTHFHRPFCKPSDSTACEITSLMNHRILMKASAAEQ